MAPAIHCVASRSKIIGEDAVQCSVHALNGALGERFSVFDAGGPTKLRAEGPEVFGPQIRELVVAQCRAFCSLVPNT